MKKLNKKESFFDELKVLLNIIQRYKDENKKESLSLAEVDRLVKILKNQINLIEGNISEDEYEEFEKEARQWD